MTQKHSVAGKTSKTRKQPARMLIDDVTAIVLISPNARRLCEFYKTTLGLPLEEELHDGAPLHYGYSLGDVHFASTTQTKVGQELLLTTPRAPSLHSALRI